MRDRLPTIASDAAQLDRIGDGVDSDDPAVDDGEADDTNRASVGHEHGTCLAVDHGWHNVRNEPRSGLQHTRGHGIGTADRKTSARRKRSTVSTEDNIRVENLQQPAHVSGPSSGEERVDATPL